MHSLRPVLAGTRTTMMGMTLMLLNGPDSRPGSQHSPCLLYNYLTETDDLIGKVFALAGTAWVAHRQPSSQPATVAAVVVVVVDPVKMHKEHHRRCGWQFKT